MCSTVALPGLLCLRLQMRTKSILLANARLASSSPSSSIVGSHGGRLLHIAGQYHVRMHPLLALPHSMDLRVMRGMAGGGNDPKDTPLPAVDEIPVDEGPVDPDDPSGQMSVYKGILSTQIRLVKTFSLMTSVIGLAFQPVLYVQAQSGQNMGLILAVGSFFSFFTFATPLLIHHISKKYVTELYYNKMEDSYTAITYSLLLQRKKLKFRLQDVQVPDIPGMFTTFKARNVPLFVDGQQFFVPQHYGKIMGYDKPLNLRWPVEEKKAAQEQEK